ncbi:hypothetical protein MTR_0009s0270 [Medicago truncatula]|uniref:Uncharacterized protein n=1 Tax=Medicago truncatula TaxID=3880 RepID=A0A072TKZ2_MEDTR|nr:hypothetical protein MTR_0009s0270 [Medicago truncatula]
MPPLSGVISHVHKAQDYSWHGTVIIPPSYLFCFPQVQERIFDGLSLGAKERGFGADSEQKYEDSETKICLPQVRSLARPVLTLARPCHTPRTAFCCFCLDFTLLYSSFLMEHSSDVIA